MLRFVPIPNVRFAKIDGRTLCERNVSQPRITLPKRTVRPNSVPACSLTQARARKVGGAGAARSLFQVRLLSSFGGGGSLLNSYSESKGF